MSDETYRKRPEKEEHEPVSPLKHHESPDLCDRINFSNGATHGIRCGYCNDSITAAQQPVVREFWENTGITSRIYHTECATEYAEELRWKNLPQEEKERLRREATSQLNESLHSLSEITAEHDKIKKMSGNSFLLRTITPFSGVFYGSRSDKRFNPAKIDASCSGLFSDVVLVGCVYKIATDVYSNGIFSTKDLFFSIAALAARTGILYLMHFLEKENVESNIQVKFNEFQEAQNNLTALEARLNPHEKTTEPPKHERPAH